MALLAIFGSAGEKALFFGHSALGRQKGIVTRVESDFPKKKS